MSATELLLQKAKNLTDSQAAQVLAYIEQLDTSPRISASALMQMPPAQRRAILHAQAEKAATLYRTAPEMIAEDKAEPMPYG